MKKILLTMIASFLICGCSETTIKQIGETQSSQAITQNTPGVCSESNPPKVEGGKFGYTLNRCGEKTNYSAYEVPDKKYILFTVDVWNEDTREHEYTLMSIDTIPPFTESAIRKGIPPTDSMKGPYVLDRSKSIAWFTMADAPGSLFSLFIFKPDTKDYLFLEKNCNSNFDCDTKMTLIGSKNETNLNFSESNATEEEKKLMACNLSDSMGIYRDLTSGDEEDVKSMLEQYAGYVPDKIFCYWEPPKVTGYIDLINYRFVATLQL